MESRKEITSRHTSQNSPAKAKEISQIASTTRELLKDDRTTIADLGNHCIDNVIFAIQRVANDQGMSKDIDKESSVKILEFIRGNYSDLKPQEIVLASDLEIMGRIEVSEKHFGTLTLKWIAKLLNAYKFYKLNVLVPQIMKQESDKPRQRTKAELEKTYESICQNIERVYKKHVSGENINSDLYTPHAFQILEKVGLISLSSEEKNNILKQAREDLKKETGERRSEFDSIPAYEAMLKALSQEKNVDVKYRARIMAVKNYFDEFKKETGSDSILETARSKKSVYVTESKSK